MPQGRALRSPNRAAIQRAQVNQAAAQAPPPAQVVVNAPQAAANPPPAVAVVPVAAPAAINGNNIACRSELTAAGIRARVTGGPHDGTMLTFAAGVGNRVVVGRNITCDVVNGVVVRFTDPIAEAERREQQRLQEVSGILEATDWHEVDITTTVSAEGHTNARGSGLRREIRDCLSGGTVESVVRRGAGRFEFRKSVPRRVVLDAVDLPHNEDPHDWCIIGEARLANNEVTRAHVWHHGPAA
jgi:hypothetical protein